MTPEHSPRSIARRTLLYAGVIVVAVALFLLLLGPRVWAQGQINLFGLEVVRSWTETPLNPGQDACSPGVDAATGQRMQARLEQAADYDPHASLHQGAAACLQGDLPQAEAAWAAGIGEHPYDLMMSLFAAVTAYADGRMIETPYSDEIGRHGHKQCVKTDRTGDIQAAIDWCEFAFAYTPNKTTAGKLASLYERLGDESGAQAVWLRLQETLASSSPDYWWALGQSAEQEKDWPAAADAYQRGAALAGEKDAFRYSLRAGLMWLRAKDYAGAESVYRQALARELDRQPRFLIAAQPTRGVDIGATEYIHAQLLKQRTEGLATLLISEDLDEVKAISDRIMVLFGGEVMGIVDNDEVTIEELGLMMAGERREVAE